MQSHLYSDIMAFFFSKNNGVLKNIHLCCFQFVPFHYKVILSYMSYRELFVLSLDT
jgi:hypothetical protein